MPFACLLAPHLLAVHCALYGCILCICISHINVASHVFVPINRDSYSMCWPCIRPKNQFQSHCVQYEGHLYCTLCELCRNHLFFFQFGSIYTVSPIVFHFSHPQTTHTLAHTLSQCTIIENLLTISMSIFNRGQQNDSETQRNHITYKKNRALARNINVPI